MIYTFTENDIALLGVTDEDVKSILLKTSIVDSGYNGGLEMYVAPRKPQFHYLGGVDVRYNTGYSTLITLQKEDNRVRIVFYDDAQLNVGSENLSGVETYSVHYTKGKIGQDGGSSGNSTVHKVNISELSNLYIKGGANLFGVVYDGDKTVTFGDNSITIDVYDENGFTIKGQKGVKGIIYNGNRVKELVLNGVKHLMKDKIICTNGVELQKPPIIGNFYGDKGNHWLVRDDVEYYDLYYCSSGFGYYDGQICAISSGKLNTSSAVKWYRISKASPTNYWVYNKEMRGYISLTNTPLIASVDDIKVFSNESTPTSEVYFNKTHWD